MKTTYYKPRTSPLQALRNRAFNTQDSKHPAREEIERCVGSFSIDMIVEEDTSTLALLNRVPGLIAFLCTLKKDGQIISQGRGSATINLKNKFLERAVHTAFGSAVVDAIVRSAKVLDTLLPNGSEDTKAILNEAYQARESNAFEPATDKQKSYLRELLQMNIEDDDEREERMNQIDELSKEECSKAIQAYAR